MMHILALVPGGIGDQLLFFPTIEELKRYYPDANIDIVAEPRAMGAYRVSKFYHEGSLRVLPFDFKDRNGMSDWGNLIGIIRDREYDLVLSLGKRWAVKFLLWMTGIPKRIGYTETSGSWLLTDAVPLKTEQYAAHMYHDLVQGLGIQSPCPPISINLLKQDLDWAESQQQRLGVKDSGYILVHGGSSQLAQSKGLDKLYPVENWQKILSEWQQRQPNLPIVVAKGPEDEAWVRQLSQAVDDLKIISPPDIGKLAATIAGANVMLCTDSAPMHLAVAVETYTIALFGPTDPKKLLPESDKFIGIQSPSGKMSDISAEMVLEKLLGQ